MVEEITVASVDRWASIFRNLVKQLQGRPQKMMEIFCTEVHPYFLNDFGASEIVDSQQNRDHRGGQKWEPGGVHIMVLGAYWVQAQQLSTAALYASIPVGILVAAILYINEIPDRMWDEKAGKRTLITRISPDTAVTGYAVLIVAAYLSWR